MKLRYFILPLLGIIASCTLQAQTLEQARAMFTKGEYEKAKPVFQRFVKSQPANANYNYWYGVCCLETGQPAEAIKYLETANKKRVQNAPLRLGQAYDLLYRFEEAVDAYEEYLEGLRKRKQSTDEVKALQDRSRANARMLKGVEEVCFIDSFVVDKANFLQVYKLSEESGSLYTFNEFFQTTGDNQGTVYETELKNKIYYSEFGEDNTQNILSKNKLLDEWSKGYPLPESINSGANVNYPFVLTDGVTIYYASDGEGSMGGYDIFVTRYNTGTESYLSAENVGMPFNSPFNDYMYVIDEYNDLGWFATDRYQPEDKVCVYVFIPNTSKVTYNYEGMEQRQISSLAQLRSIEDTWKDEEEVEAARKRLEAAIHQKPQETVTHDFEFIINDHTVYYSVDKFKSPEARRLFMVYQQMEKDYNQQRDKLTSQRKWYAEAKEDERKKIAPAIIDLEERVLQMENELDKQRVKIRNEENKHIKQ